MSQSDLHRNLVIQVQNALQMRHPEISIVTDIQLIPGSELPPQIGKYRPDVYGYVQSSRLTAIAEAKTDEDIDNTHTCNQLTAFIHHLEHIGNGILVLIVNGHRANLAKTVLRFLCREIRVTRTKIAVFDGCDFWWFDIVEGMIWHLD